MSSSIACIAYENGKIFIAKRQNVGDMGGRWEFPGGKIEEGEDCKTAIVREMQEEFGVTVEVFDNIATGYFEHKGKKCRLDAFLVKFPRSGEEEKFVLTEHTEYKWVEPEVIPTLNFVDSDLMIYPEVMKYLGK